MLTSLYGVAHNTIALGRSNEKQIFIDRIHKFKKHFQYMLNHVKITKKDILVFLKSITKQTERRWSLKKTLLYLDPPYSISKGSLPDNRGWNIGRLEEVLVYLSKYKWNYAISEFNDQPIIDLFTKYGLNINYISKNTGITASKGHTKFEILATSYKVSDQIAESRELQNGILGKV